MKKFLLILTFIAFAGASYGQSIAFRKDTENSIAIGTNFRLTTFFGKNNTGTALSIITSKGTGDKECYLGIYSQMYGKTFSQQKSKAIFKTFAGNIVTLEQYTTTGDCCYERKRVGDYPSTKYALQANYIISEDNLRTLMNEGVAKLRIETLSGLKDYEYDKDYLGEFIRSEYNLIQEQKTFDSDF